MANNKKSDSSGVQKPTKTTKTGDSAPTIPPADSANTRDPIKKSEK
jgi:hypothetical protein